MVKKTKAKNNQDAPAEPLELTPAQKAYEAQRKKLTPLQTRSPLPHGQKNSPKMREAVLTWLRFGATPSRAAKECQLGTRTVYEWRQADLEFAAQWDQAVTDGIARLEDEATRRAVDGVDEPVFQGGECVGFKRVYSDDLLKFVLSARDPKRFSRNAQNDSGATTNISFTFDLGSANVSVSAERTDVAIHAAENGNVPAIVDFNDDRYSVIEATTKAGKTAGCIVWLIEQAMQGKKGENFWWVAPVNTQTDIAFTRARNGLPLAVYETDLTHKTMTLANGAVLWFKSADNPDTLFGDDVKAAIIDEASRVKEESWFALRTTLTATRGKLRIIGNVKGKKNWFYALARRAEAGEPDMSYHRMTANDAVAAGILYQAEINDARRVLPDRVFRELYMAEPSDDGSNPFGIEAIRKCVTQLSGQLPAVWGWDLAKSVDWTVGIALDRGGDTCQFHRWQAPWDSTVTRINDYTRSTPALVDSTGVGDPILRMLQKKPGARVEGYLFSGPSKQKLMEGLSLAIQSGSVSFPDGPIRQELENFEFQYTRTGVRYSAPEGFHDDCVCALALAVMHKTHARQPMRITDAMIAMSRR